MAVYLSATSPVIAAPAMDEDMWKHPATRSNITRIEQFGNLVIPVEKGELASGLNGEGRMAEPEHIVTYLEHYFSKISDLAGKKVLVTAGPTFEAIDPVRFIGNHSTGKMGIAIARECVARGAYVTLVCGPSGETLPAGVNAVRVTSAAEMYDACIKVFPDVDIAVMSAAVADYTITNPATQKIKKDHSSLVLELEKTRDILKALGEQKKSSQVLVGFALETNNEKENALKKMSSKKADMIVLNSLNDPGAGFGYDSNKIVIFDRKGQEYSFESKSKTAVATDIINSIIKFSHA